VLLVFLSSLTKNQDVIKVCKTKMKVLENVIHEALECLCCIPQSEGHVRELKEHERSGNGSFLDVVRVDRDLLVRPDKVKFGENFASC
jgi:hypothetical protein